MELSRLARSFGLATSLTLATSGLGLATSATAADAPQLKLFAPTALSIDPTAVPEPHSAGNLGLSIGRTGTKPVDDVTVTYDTKDLAGIAALQLSGRCTTAGTVSSGATSYAAIHRAPSACWVNSV